MEKNLVEEYSQIVGNFILPGAGCTPLAYGITTIEILATAAMILSNSSSVNTAVDTMFGKYLGKGTKEDAFKLIYFDLIAAESQEALDAASRLKSLIDQWLDLTSTVAARLQHAARARRVMSFG